MAGQLHALPGGQIGKNLPARFLNLFFDLRGLLLEADAQLVGLRLPFPILQLAL